MTELRSQGAKLEPGVLGTQGPGRLDSWWFGALAFVVRLVACIVAWSAVPPTADGKFYHVVAERIANGEGYTWLWPDGAVTFAAHYPIGYPALMSVPYGVFGPVPGVVMLINALLGAIAVGATHALCRHTLQAFRSRTAPESNGDYERVLRWSAGGIGVLLALSPTLVGYTPALMTEGAVAAFLALAALFCLAPEQERRALRLSLVVMCLAAAVYLRPQSVLFAPVLGGLAAHGSLKSRVVSAVIVSLGCLVLVAPWTLRNCDKMERCVFVSANGGWNLLIGTFPEGNGAWVPLEGERVPDGCREVFQEAAKDKCFGQAGLDRIQEEPLSWLSLVPAKLRATLDFTAAASDHLAEAGAISLDQKKSLAALEFVFQRLNYLLALLGAVTLLATGTNGAPSWGLRLPELKRPLPALALGLGLLGFGGLGAHLGWAVVVVVLALRPRNCLEVGVGYGVFAVVSTAVVHGAFFGAGRYALPLIVSTAPLSALGLAALWTSVYSSRRSAQSTEV
jgi:hypothetical protein